MRDLLDDDDVREHQKEWRDLPDEEDELYDQRLAACHDIHGQHATAIPDVVLIDALLVGEGHEIRGGGNDEGDKHYDLHLAARHDVYGQHAKAIPDVLLIDAHVAGE